MDIRIRRNELCVVGLPRCDFAFSSTRTCFIAYGFVESSLEMSILSALLTDRGIEPIEASGHLAPGQNAFCAKICSKIITAQFCIVLLNNDTVDEIEKPNANVNMEYGLILGFNKFVIPFQRESQSLPFNVAGLDTIKYTNQTFKAKAASAIDKAIAATTQSQPPNLPSDQTLEAFLLAKSTVTVPITTPDERAFFELGRPLGFNLLMTFDGMQYRYFGNFTALRAEAVIWRIQTLIKIISERFASIPKRVQMGLVQLTPEAIAGLGQFLKQVEIWILVTSDNDREIISNALKLAAPAFKIHVFSLGDMETALKALE